MATNSREYWKQREAENLKKNLKTEAKYLKELEDIYKYTLDQVQKEINNFYARYAAKEGISLSIAKRRVSKLDIEEYSRKAKRYVRTKNFSKQANEEMRLYNLTMKVNRLELLKAQIGLELTSGFNELQKHQEDILKRRAQEEFARQAGILGKTVANNTKLANAIVNASFKNAKFSDRIWMHQDMLKSELSKLLKTGLIQGRNSRELARQVRRAFDTSKYNSERLMRTELARVQIEAQKQSYIRNGFDEYQFQAIGNACDICKDLDGKHFKVSKMMPGDNAPPMHPNCRCSTSAYTDRKEYEEWLDGYKEHGTSFADWKKLKNSGKAVAKPIKNGIIQSGAVSGALNPNSDRAQKHANQYYESVRHMKTDVSKIAKNVGWKEEAINKIKNYVFLDEHGLLEGRARFSPSYDMAQSWQRLIDGRKIKEQDLVLLKHEYLEMKLVEKGVPQDEAHIVASKKHNFAKYLE